MTMEPEVSSARTSTRRAYLGLAILVLAALLLRWPVSTRLLPHAPEPDTYLVELAQDYRGDPALVEHVDYAERYPVLLARTLATLPWPSPDVHPDDPGAADAMLAGAAAPYQAGRWLVLAFSLLMIPGTWLVGRRLAGERAAWIAAALVATSMLHALFSTQARPHAPQATVAVFAVWAAMRLAEKPSIARQAVAVVLASVALSTLQIGAATLPPLALAAWLAGGAVWKRLGRAAGLCALAVLGAAWAYPFALDVLKNGLRLGGKGAHEVDFAAADFSGFGQLVRRLVDHDPTLAVLLAAAVASVIVRWRASMRAAVTRKDVAIACGFALPYLAVVGPLNEVFERFLLPLLPWIAVLSAAVLVRLAGERRGRIAAIASLALIAPLLLAVKFARVSNARDTSELVVDWLARQSGDANVAVITSPGLVLPVPYGAEALRADLDDQVGVRSVWTKYQGTRPDAEFPHLRANVLMTPSVLAQKPSAGLAAWVDAVQPTYIVLERTKKNLFLAGGRELTAIARERGTLVYRTDGEAPEIETKGLLHFQSMDDFTRRLLRTDRFGAAIEVWRLTR